ncbi:MAG: hypothetical protein Q4E65_07530 [Clostridia bacterium]|nr:hypothetical protein [Clostridia bacterium]
MKRKTHMVSLFADIRRSVPICASLSAIVMMGVLFYVGIVFASQGIRDSMDDYFRRVRYQDFLVSSSSGFSDADIARLRALPDVEDVEGGFVFDAYLPLGRDKRVVSVQSLTTRMNDAELVAGRLPAGDGECVIEEAMLNEGLAIGDALELDFASLTSLVNARKWNLADAIRQYFGGSFSLRTFNTHEWTVTGVIRHPAAAVYVEDRRGISSLGGGFVQNYVFLAPEAIRGMTGDDPYNILYVRDKETAHAYSDAARQASARIKDEIAQLDPEWSILERSDTILYQSMKIASENLSRTGLSFACIFIGVAALVCYTSFTRVIQDRRVVIGMQKANGLRVSELLRHYLLYAAFCAIPGVLSGIAAGYLLLQPFLVQSYMTNLTIGAYTYAFAYPTAIVSALVALSVIISSALVAVIRLLRRPAAQLMRAQNDDGDGSRLGAWLNQRGISMRHAILILNLRADTNRLITTVLSIAGCTALIVIGLSMKLGLARIPDMQYRQIQKNDTILTLQDDADADKWRKFLDQQGVAHAQPVHAYACGFRFKQAYNLATVIVAMDEGVTEDVALLDPYTGRPVALPDAGILLSVRTSEYFGVAPGDSIELIEADGATYSATVSGVIDNYIDHLIVMRAGYYQAISGKEAAVNQYYLRLDGQPDDALIAAASREAGYVGYTSAEYKRVQFDSLSASMNALVALMIGLSAALAVVVLYQLMQLTLNKKAAELSVMYANGFTGQELRGYISKENKVMTVLGLLLGVGAGVGMTDRVMRTLESDTVRTLHGANPTACLLAVGLTALLCVLIEWFLLLRWNPRQTFLRKTRQWMD